MGYAHIENLYKNKNILCFKECYVMEKVHGTSAHIKRGKDGVITYSSGGASASLFRSLFDETVLKLKLDEVFGTTYQDTITIYGEAYGGKEQGMSLTYGKELKFIVFDIQVGAYWLDVLNAADTCAKIGIEFVPFFKIDVSIDSLNAARDLPSVVADRRGCRNNTDKFGFNPPIREGIVVRPVFSCFDQYGERVVSKHKREEFSERKSTPAVNLADTVKILDEANAIADEWVTPMRLEHVLDKLGNVLDFKKIPEVVAAMVEDVYREGKGEIVESKEVEKAIKNKTVFFYKKLITKV